MEDLEAGERRNVRIAIVGFGLTVLGVVVGIAFGAAGNSAAAIISGVTAGIGLVVGFGGWWKKRKYARRLTLIAATLDAR